MGSSLVRLDEVLRAARSRSHVDLSGLTVSRALEDGRRRARAGDVPGALSSFEAAYDLILLQNPSEVSAAERAEVLLALAAARRKSRLFVSAQEAAAAALDIASDEDLHARALVQLVSIACMTGDLFRARLYGQEVERLIDGRPPQLQARAWQVLGHLHSNAGNLPAALRCLARACDLHEAHGDLREATRTGITFALCLCESGAVEAAIGRLQKIIARVGDLGDRDIGVYA